MDVQRYQETSNVLKRKLRAARREICSYTREHVSAMDKLSHVGYLKEIKAVVVEVVNSIDLFPRRTGGPRSNNILGGRTQQHPERGQSQ